MQEHIPSAYQIRVGSEDSESAIHLSSTPSICSGPFHFSFEAIRSNLFRTTFFSDSHPLPPYPSVEKPSTDLGGLHITKNKHPNTNVEKIAIGEVEARIDLSPPCPVINLGFKGQTALHQDLPHRSYAVDGTGISHYTKYTKNTLHVGLGEKAAPLDLSNRQFTLSATDCFGYDIYRTDPMYKHIPLLINATPQGCIAMFSTSHSRGSYSVGSEMDGLWGPYKVYRQDHGGLEEYLLIGHTLQEIVKTYADLVGYPQLVPRWAFGYLAGGMKYSMLDDPPAHEALMTFADKLKEHDIPCSGFQLSSGYTVSKTGPRTRNVFTWNKHRFPDPNGWIDAYHKRGIRIIANVKPYVLENHPEYAKLVAAGAFLKKDGKSATARLWSAGGGESGIGGHIDFTSRAGYQWWYNGVQSLARLGIDCIWNDNNEYVTPDDTWTCALSTPALATIPSSHLPYPADRSIGLLGRSLQSTLHAHSSHSALTTLSPTTRPFILTRSASPSTMTYASSTWSGDNVTSWATLCGSISLSLNAGLSLLHTYGHDIGGFEGPQPSPELLLRWMQMGVYSMRFAVNCYKTSPQDNSVGEVIELWMYPEILPEIRKAVKRRYEILPWVYSLHLESCLFAKLPVRWVGCGAEGDSVVWSSEVLRRGEQYSFGDALIVGGVYEEGRDTGRVYLPIREAEGDPGYVNLNPPYQYLLAGQWVDVWSPWRESIPLLARVGSAIPVGRDVQVLSPGEKGNVARLSRDDWRGVEIFPPAERSVRSGNKNKNWRGRLFETIWYEDDGASAEIHVASYTVRYQCVGDQISVGLERNEGQGFTAEWRSLDVILPVGDGRVVVGLDGGRVEALGRDQTGRGMWRLSDGDKGTEVGIAVAKL